jgi:hypothetical protein
MKIKDLLSDKSKWTQGSYARDAEGRACDVDSPCADKFCLTGAAVRVYDGPAVWGALRAIARAIPLDYHGGMEIEHWNDRQDRTFYDVRQVLEKADI